MKKPACGARTRNGGACRKTPMPNGRCRLHGGLSRPPGPTHHSYRTGRYSKALEGEAIATLYEVARNDPKLLALREDIALLGAKQQETVARLRTGESEAAWKVLHECWQRADDAVRRGALAECTEPLRAMGAVLGGSMGDADVWREYTERAEHMRRLVDTERKYEEGLRLYLPLDRANAIMGVWLDCIKRVLPQEHIARLHEEVRRVRSDMPYTNNVH